MIHVKNLPAIEWLMPYSPGPEHGKRWSGPIMHSLPENRSERPCYNLLKLLRLIPVTPGVILQNTRLRIQKQLVISVLGKPWRRWHVKTRPSSVNGLRLLFIIASEKPLEDGCKIKWFMIYRPYFSIRRKRGNAYSGGYYVFNGLSSSKWLFIMIKNN